MNYQYPKVDSGLRLCQTKSKNGTIYVAPLALTGGNGTQDREASYFLNQHAGGGLQP